MKVFLFGVILLIARKTDMCRQRPLPAAIVGVMGFAFELQSSYWFVAVRAVRG